MTGYWPIAVVVVGYLIFSYVQQKLDEKRFEVDKVRAAKLRSERNRKLFASPREARRNRR